ncbi:MAG: AAA family ATPase [bacterium]|nr:AAA family ATPase [bacterium]
MHLTSVHVPAPFGAHAETFPFNIPLVKAAPKIDFTAPVTFFVGENGSGKSTLLEAIASAAGSITVGTADTENDVSLAAVRKLAKTLKLAWRKKTRKGFFLRSEDYFGYVRRLARTRAELERELQEAEADYQGKSELARAMGTLPYKKELHALNTRYHGDLDNRSHGESYLAFFQARFVPDGLYLLDEPEAPLSPVRQLAMIAMLKQMVGQGAQFIIATHSPILMAFPGAAILSFDTHPPRPVAYETLEHVTLTRDFLNNPEQFLNHL